MKKNNTYYMKQFIRFACVGGGATLIDFILYMLFALFIHITLAKLLSMLFASIYSYILNKSWTFNNRRQDNWRYIIKYVISQIANIVVNVTINSIVFFYTNSKINAFLIATCIAMIVNFLLQKLFVFKEREGA